MSDIDYEWNLHHEDDKVKKLEAELDSYREHYTRREFHGYTILNNGTILSKKGEPMKFELRPRKGGGADQTVRLYIGGEPYKFTVQRLIAAAFQGPIFGYEINHNDRDTMNNNNYNLDRLTPSENQIHWRKDNERKMI